MGIKNKLEEYQVETFMEQHGDRLAPVYGNVLSVKVDRQKKFFIYHTLNVNLVVKPMGSRNVVRCNYKKKGFKEPKFIDVRMGNEVLVQGVKGDRGKESAETITIMNLININDRTQLVEDASVSVDEIIKSVKGSTKISRKKR